MKTKIFLLIAAVIFIFILVGSYTVWNRLDPDNTCAKCHEIVHSHERWKTSAHANVRCIECHGTAFSGGLKSFSGKMNMVYVHFTQSKYNDEIRLKESDVLEVHNRCIVCHQSEHAGWLASGHSVNYKEIFTDSVHNALEKPYWDCLRCHGMFYDGNINSLMALESTNPAEWKIRNEKQGMLPTVPCLACHMMHTDNPVSERYLIVSDSTKMPIDRNPKTALYVRSDKMHLRSDKLSKAAIFDNDGQEIAYATDPNTLLCMQCHAPNYKHQALSEDDRTVTGVHAGISCIACHKPHSGETKSSCILCHSTLTEQQIKWVFDNPHTYAK